jgi:hypothetical protein
MVDRPEVKFSDHYLFRLALAFLQHSTIEGEPSRGSFWGEFARIGKKVASASRRQREPNLL